MQKLSCRDTKKYRKCGSTGTIEKWYRAAAVVLWYRATLILCAVLNMLFQYEKILLFKLNSLDETLKCLFLS